MKILLASNLQDKKRLVQCSSLAPKYPGRSHAPLHNTTSRSAHEHNTPITYNYYNNNCHNTTPRATPTSVLYLPTTMTSFFTNGFFRRPHKKTPKAADDGDDKENSSYGYPQNKGAFVQTGSFGAPQNFAHIACRRCMPCAGDALWSPVLQASDVMMMMIQ